MRKRNISFIADKLLWFIILLLPVLFALIFTCASMNNYTLAVSDDTSDSYSYVRYDFNDTSTDVYNFHLHYLGQDPYNNYPIYSTNLYNDTIYFSDRSQSFTINFYSYSFGTYELSYSGTFVLSQYGIENDDYTIFENYGSTSDTIYTLVSYGCFSFIDDEFGGDDIFISIIGDGVDDFGYYEYLDNTIIPQSDNIFKTYFANLNYSLDNWFTFGDRDIVYNAFNSIFGSQSNIMPIFVEGSFIPKYLTYMAWIYVLHLAFDFLVFIPRLAHKWMGGVYKDEDS